MYFITVCSELKSFDVKTFLIVEIITWGKIDERRAVQLWKFKFLLFSIFSILQSVFGTLWNISIEIKVFFFHFSELNLTRILSKYNSTTAFWSSQGTLEKGVLNFASKKVEVYSCVLMDFHDNIHNWRVHTEKRKSCHAPTSPTNSLLSLFFGESKGW